MALNYSFAGKRILITGGTRGIGRHLVQFFHDEGGIVYTIGTNPELIKKLGEELPKVTAEIADLNDWQKTRQVIESFGAIDYLVNNAILTDFVQPFMNITEESAKRQFNVNVGGVINVSQVVAKGVMNRGSDGAIVNISSVASRKSYDGLGVYSSTKAAVESLTRTMAKELGPHNVRVNCVVIGVVDSGASNAEILGKELFEYCENIKKKMHENRFVEAKEVAQLVAFMLSPMASMIVSEAYVIDGGLSKA